MKGRVPPVKKDDRPVTIVVSRTTELALVVMPVEGDAITLYVHDLEMKRIAELTVNFKNLSGALRVADGTVDPGSLREVDL